jgi:hypothetical protein
MSEMFANTCCGSPGFQSSVNASLSTNLAKPVGVPGVRRGRRSARLRAHRLSKLCAFVFIALILTPFTAPFPTFDFRDMSGGHPYDALPKDVKDGKDTIGADKDSALAFSEWLTPPTLDSAISGDFGAQICHPLRDHLPQHVILRL